MVYKRWDQIHPYMYIYIYILQTFVSFEIFVVKGF
jgi:hypothetical protein